MNETFVIDSEKYGNKSAFTGLEEAEAAMHACGPDFADVKFVRRGDVIIDQDGVTAGSVVSTEPTDQAIAKLKTERGEMSLDDFELWVLNNVEGANWENYLAVTGRIIYALEGRRLLRVILADEGFMLRLR